MATLRTLGIAVGAGLASALLFAASAHGASAALLLAYITPLPIMIATLAFGHATGVVAAAVATCGLGASLGLLPGIFFGLLLGFPSWWLPYLALLARPEAASVPGAPPVMHWYPVGRVVTWAAATVPGVILGLGALLLLHFGGFDQTVSVLAGRLDTVLGRSAADELSGTASTRHIVQGLPVLMSASAFLMLCINLWLAGRITERSGLLSRPWPSLPETLRLPRAALGILAVAALCLVVGGAVRVAGGVVAAGFAMAFALQGLAAAHALTRGLAIRRLILFAIYLIVFSVVPSIIGLAILGVVDCVAPLRQRTDIVTPPISRS